jgi:hypothetical protein
MRQVCRGYLCHNTGEKPDHVVMFSVNRLLILIQGEIQGKMNGADTVGTP